METSYYISVAIKKYLDEHDMKSYKLAEASGCNKTAVNNWLYQRQMPSTRALVKLADYMNVSLDYILGRSENKSIIRRIAALQSPTGVSSYRIAKECGMGTSAVSKWNDFKRLPKIEILMKLADLFGCSVDYLVGRTNLPY